MAYSPKYTTTTRVRNESGLTNSTNISDTRILNAISAAEAEIDGVLQVLYTLPLSDNSNWSGSQAQYYLQGIATDLTVGMLLVEQYGVEAEGTSKDGYAKIDRIRGNEDKGIMGELEKLSDRVVQLIGSDGNVLVQSSTATIAGWPDSTTEDEDSDDAGGEVLFRISDQY